MSWRFTNMTNDWVSYWHGDREYEVTAADQRRDAETALQRAARAAAEKIQIEIFHGVASEWTVNKTAAIIYQTIRDAREI